MIKKVYFSKRFLHILEALRIRASVEQYAGEGINQYVLEGLLRVLEHRETVNDLDSIRRDRSRLAEKFGISMRSGGRDL